MTKLVKLEARRSKNARLPVPPPNHPEASATADPFSIPPMLDRKVNGIKDNPKVAVAVPAEPRPTQAEENNATFAEARAAEKKEKSRVRVEKMKAKKAGATTAMPLSGKAALQAIAQAAVENGKPITKCPAGMTAEQVAKREAKIDKQARKGTPARSPGYARLKASGKAEALRKETAAMQKAATKVKPAGEGSAKPKAKKATSAARKGKGRDGQSKSSIVRAMLTKGATRKAIVEAAEWPSINLKRQAEIAGKRLIEKDGVYRFA